MSMTVTAKTLLASGGLVGATALLGQVADGLGSDTIKTLVTSSPVLATLFGVVWMFLNHLDKERTRSVQANEIAWKEVGAMREASMRQAMAAEKLEHSMSLLAEKLSK